MGIALGGLTLAFARRKSDSTGIELTKDEEQQIKVIREAFDNNMPPPSNDDGL